jgi:hypothetical protein
LPPPPYPPPPSPPLPPADPSIWARVGDFGDGAAGWVGGWLGGGDDDEGPATDAGSGESTDAGTSFTYDAPPSPPPLPPSIPLDLESTIIAVHLVLVSRAATATTTTTSSFSTTTSPHLIHLPPTSQFLACGICVLLLAIIRCCATLHFRTKGPGSPDWKRRHAETLALLAKGRERSDDASGAKPKRKSGSGSGKSKKGLFPQEKPKEKPR